MAQSAWTAIVGQDEGWWIGWIAEIPGVNAQERTERPFSRRWRTFFERPLR